MTTASGARPFLGLMHVLEWLRKPLQPLADRLLGAPDPAPAHAALRSFELEAEELMSARLLRQSRLVVRAAVFVVAVLLLWAGFASIDEVTRGDGKVIPSRQLQVVQSLDGGVVTEILVSEGQTVEAGDVLLRLEEVRATSDVRESAAQGFALQARQARLRAVAEDTRFVPPRASGSAEQRIVDEERRLYESRQNELATSLSINQQQLQQRQQELGEMRVRRSTAERNRDLAQQELDKTRPLLSTGAVSEVEILRLERDVAKSRGDAEQALTQIARVQAAIGEAQRKLQETEIVFRNEARKELAEVVGKLNALDQGAVGLADKVNKAQVKSPVRGRVQRLLANTVGGVVQPGKDIVEIVPIDDALVLETKVAPRDIAFIHPEQKATVRLTAYDFAVYGGLDAVVENISPDTVVDDRGNAYYLVRVRTERDQFNERLPIIPGMTAEVDILTGRKTVLSYLLKPVLRAHTHALRER